MTTAVRIECMDRPLTVSQQVKLPDGTWSEARHHRDMKPGEASVDYVHTTRRFVIEEQA